jgi:hypothetical protein
VKAETIRKFILPPGPILSLTLIGLLLLSAVLYYRAIKIQRFLEPALAVSEPRIRFTQGLNDLLLREFGTLDIPGVSFRTQSVLINQSNLLISAHHPGHGDPMILKKMGNVFLSALDSPEIRGHINLILVGVRFPVSPDAAANRKIRALTLERAGLILNSLYSAQPELERKYWGYFAATAFPVNSPRQADWIELRIVPTERLHIEVLQRLEKYIR